MDEVAPSELHGAPCGLLIFDDRGIITQANARLADWVSIPIPKLVGAKIASVFTIPSRVVFETSLSPLLTLQGRVEGASLDLMAHDGEPVPVLLSAEAVGAGQDRRIQAAFLKAGARRDFERDLAEARAKAEAALARERDESKLREQFVAILGHDLRNPLASISAAVHILSREELSEGGQNVLLLTQGSVQRISRLIDNVLDFARTRLGDGLNLDLSGNSSLQDQLRQVVDELRAVEPERVIHLELSIQHRVSCDVWRVGQLLSNLLGNALTYGDVEHPVEVAVETSDADAFVLSVTNRGEPIPASAMDRLFDPFERSMSSGRSNGLGLGLYIASEIAKAHGGKLTADSDVERTVFSFSMPAA